MSLAWEPTTMARLAWQDMIDGERQARQIRRRRIVAVIGAVLAMAGGWL